MIVGVREGALVLLNKLLTAYGGNANYHLWFRPLCMFNSFYIYFLKEIKELNTSSYVSLLFSSVPAVSSIVRNRRAIQLRSCQFRLTSLMKSRRSARARPPQGKGHRLEPWLGR
jgi:hypothetical protein